MHNYQQLNLKKNTLKIKQTKETSRTGTESQKQRSHGGLSAGRGNKREKGTGNEKHKWQVQNKQGGVKNSVRNGEAKSSRV